MMKNGFGGMGNLIKQAQKMQKDMQKMQEELELKEIETTAGGGAVKVVMNGKKQIKSIKINPEVIDKDEVEMLEDLIKAAVNEAVTQIEGMVNSQMSTITGGVNLPGGLF